MSIEITNETSAEVDEARILKLASYVLDQLHIHQDAELAIMFVETGPMEELHIQWMDEPGPTDVLSFPMDELRPGAVDRPIRACSATLLCARRSPNSRRARQDTR